MNKAESTFRAAFERLKAETPINVPKGTKISQNNIAKEAGKHPTALKKDRFPMLVLEIQDYLKQQDIDSEVIDKKKQMRKLRTLKERLNDCANQRNKLVSICEAQHQLIECLKDEIKDLRNGIVGPTYLD